MSIFENAEDVVKRKEVIDAVKRKQHYDCKDAVCKHSCTAAAVLGNNLFLSLKECVCDAITLLPHHRSAITEEIKTKFPTNHTSTILAHNTNCTVHCTQLHHPCNIQPVYCTHHCTVLY